MIGFGTRPPPAAPGSLPFNSSICNSDGTRSKGGGAYPSAELSPTLHMRKRPYRMAAQLVLCLMTEPPHLMMRLSITKWKSKQVTYWRPTDDCDSSWVAKL